MKTLRDYANGCGQWGEGGMIDQVLYRIGSGEFVTAVEFGAGDDLTLLNTLDLASLGAHCLWVEADHQRFERLQSSDLRLADVVLMRETVTSGNVDTVLSMIGNPPTVVSIDVDGMDWWIFEAMTTRPPVVVIEHNPTVPPHVSLKGESMGASALAIVELARQKSYGLVGATEANLFFVHCPDGELDPPIGFADLDCGLEAIFDPKWLNYVVSDYQGNWMPMGPWPFGRNEERML